MDFNFKSRSLLKGQTILTLLACSAVISLATAQQKFGQFVGVGQQSYDYSPLTPIYTNNGQESGAIPQTAQDRSSIVPPYDINPYFGFRKYGEMRYEPLTMKYLSTGRSLLDNLFGGAIASGGGGNYGAAKSGKASPEEEQQAARSGRSFNANTPAAAFAAAGFGNINNGQNSNGFKLPINPGMVLNGPFGFGR